MKKMLAALLTGIMIISMVGCGGSSSAPSENQGETLTQDENVTEISDDTLDKVDRNQELIVYTNSNTNGRDAWLVEKAAEAGFKVQVLGLGASDITNRLIAEKNNSIADVTFGLNNIEYEKLKAEDLLLQWEPDWVDGVDQGLVDSDGYYYPVTTTPLLLIANNEFPNLPSDWTDLVKDEYKGLYQIHPLSGGTGKSVFASIVSRYPDPNGELGISKEGWEIAKKYIENAHIIVSGEDSIGAIIDGSLPLDQHWASGVLTEQKERNYKFNIMTPEVGEPFVVESVAVVKTSRNPELAVEFLNWLGSSEIQLAWSNEFGTIPVQEEALANVSEELKELMSIVKPQQLDWGFIAEYVDAWVEKAELEFVK